MSRPATARQGMPTPPGSPPAARNVLISTANAVAVSSPTSPRSGFLGSFMRGRSRAQSVTNAVAGAVRQRVGSPGVESPNPLNGDGGDVTRSVSSPNSGGDATALNIPPVDPSLRRTHRIRLVPVLETNRSFTFAPVLREMGVMHVPPGVLPSLAAGAVTEPGPLVNGRQPPLLIKIGRFTDKAAGAAVVGAADMHPSPGAGSSTAANGEQVTPATAAASAVGGGGGDTLSPRAAFKSKVVSRSHAEIWCEPGGKFYIRDTASSSGTFLNHIRLSSPNVQSRPQLLKDGDVLQLGVDYQGGAEEMYRCVKMRVEIGREWQRGANEFNTNALKQLKALGGGAETAKPSSQPSSASRKKASVTDCCICLFSVTVCQSLFIAPCSHVFHYKCIRPLLNQHHPGFSCPLCRTFANLDEDVETEDAWEVASRRQSIISRRDSNHSLRVAAAAQPPPEITTTGTSEPNTSILNGDVSTHSIDELLAVADTTARPDLQRQTTAVSEPSPSANGGLALSLGPDTPVSSNSHSTALPMPIGERSANTTPGGRSDTGRSDTGLTVASLAQTPMNDIFLSTLVLRPSTPGSSEPTSGAASGATSRVSHEIAEEPEEEEEALGLIQATVDDEHLLDNVHS